MKIRTIDDILLDAAGVLLEESHALAMAAKRLQDNEATRTGYHQAVRLCCDALAAGGKIVVTGVGKSGKVGEKIVATMLSTGTCAVFLHPVEALHGDLGVVQPRDVVLALSYSGQTDELLLLLPSLKRLKVPIVGLGGVANSKLAKECAAWLDGSVLQEAGDSDLPAPTASTTLALAIGDALALSLAKIHEFSPDAFAHNHPSGALGRRLLLKIEDAMVPASEVAVVDLKTPLHEIITKMTAHPRGCCAIVLNELNDTNLAGIITDKDIRKVFDTSPGSVDVFYTPAKDIMTPNPPVCSIYEKASTVKLAMREGETGHRPLMVAIDMDGLWRGVVTLQELQELL